MPISKTKELSKKIEFEPAVVGANSSESDDVTDNLQDEFINIVRPLIEDGEDDSESFRSY